MVRAKNRARVRARVRVGVGFRARLLTCGGGVLWDVDDLFRVRYRGRVRIRVRVRSSGLVLTAHARGEVAPPLNTPSVPPPPLAPPPLRRRAFLAR